MEIYKILNRINGKAYIGQTIWDFNSRYKGCWHKWTHSKYLKNSVKKHGIENFSIEILETNVLNQEKLDELEDFYIKKFNSLYPNGYNLKTGGKHGKNIKFVREYELKDVNGNIYQIINLSMFCRKNNLSYSAMLNMVSGINTSSQGYALSSTPIELILNINEEWELEEIQTGIIYKVKRKDMPNFAKSKGINIDFLQKIVRKETYVSHGFKLKDTILNNHTIRAELQKHKNIKFINPNGKEVVIENIYKFCLENNLPRTGFYNLINKKALEAYGWRLPYNEKEFKEMKELRMGKFIKIKNINTNEIFEIKNISKFCRNNNIHLGNFNIMLSGRTKQYMGYCLPETDLSNYIYPKQIVYIKLLNNEKIIEAKNPKQISEKYDISRQIIYDHIHRGTNMKIGWKVLRVKYLNDYYPEINNE